MASLDYYMFGIPVNRNESAFESYPSAAIPEPYHVGRADYYLFGVRGGVEFVVYLVVVPIQAIFGIVGNGVALVAIRKMADPISNSYLRYVAVLNCLVSCLSLVYPFGDKLGAFGGFRYVTTCLWYFLVRKVSLVADKSAGRASTLIMACFFLDRYVILTRPERTAGWRSSKVHSLVPILAILVALAWHLPLLKWYQILRCQSSTSASSHHSASNMTWEGSVCNGTRLSFGNNLEIEDGVTECHLALIKVRSLAFQVYEVSREVTLTIVPILAMVYFVYGISRSIRKFKGRSRKSGPAGGRIFPTTGESVMNPIPGSKYGGNKSMGSQLQPGLTNEAVVVRNLRLDEVRSGFRTVHKKNRATIVSLCGFVALYCISIFPSSVISIMYTLSFLGMFDGEYLSDNFSWITAMAALLNQANFCWSFYLYAILDSAFRGEIKKLFGWSRG